MHIRVDFNKHVKVEFVLNKVKRKQIPGIDELTNALKLYKEF